MATSTLQLFFDCLYFFFCSRSGFHILFILSICQMLSFQDLTIVHGEEQYSANKPGPPPLATGIKAHARDRVTNERAQFGPFSVRTFSSFFFRFSLTRQQL